MIFRIENVGPLREAEVDLSKRLLVLTGPNNTGKTYLAWSVYGLHRPALKTGSSSLEKVAAALLASPRCEIDLATTLPALGQDLLSMIAASFAGSIHHCFATEPSRFEGARISLREQHAGEALERLVQASGWTSGFLAKESGELVLLDHPEGSTRLTLAIPAPARSNMDVREVFELVGTGALVEETVSAFASMTQEHRRKVLTRLSDEIDSSVRRSLLPKCVLFPAERIAVNIFAKELALKRTELVDELVDADIDGQRQVPLDVIRRSAGRYPWPIRDSLRTANDLTRLSRSESPFADIASEIESAVLAGKMEVTSEGEMSFVPKGAPDRHLGMHLTASVVKSLSSLVFYFRHLARAGDFLIIDEPELNLHPDNQRKLARILAKAVKQGFKIMMSTHSDYIVRELNHMIMLSKLAPDDASALGYDPACALAPEDVGVYLFDEQTAKALPVTETGFSVPTIDEQINSLNADAQRLYARIFSEEPS